MMEPATDLSPNTPATKRQPKRGIYLLPNLFTTAALFAGFYAILASIDGNYQQAVIAIFLAFILDGLDGRVARLTQTQTTFGAEYDSLSDLIAFGLAPSLMMYQWAFADLGKIGWFVAFIYTATTALRLARFNTAQSEDKKYFTGLPSPSAAAILAATVWFVLDTGYQGTFLVWPAAIVTVLIGLLMVSNIRYYSFKEIDFKGKVPFISAVIIVLGFAVLLTKPAPVLFILFMTYGLSGPAMALYRLRRRKQRQAIRR